MEGDLKAMLLCMRIVDLITYLVYYYVPRYA